MKMIYQLPDCLRVEIRRSDLEKMMEPDDDYPFLYAAQRLRDEGKNKYIDKELYKLLDDPEAEDFHMESMIRDLCDKREPRQS